MNKQIKFTEAYQNLSVGILNCIYEIYRDREDYFLESRINDYLHFTTLESFWKDPELSLKALIK